MTGFSVDLVILHAAATLWEEQADNLQAARKRLVAAGGQADTLGDRVGPVAAAYFETWTAEAGLHARAAQGHANALSEIGAAYVVLDEKAADDVRQMLPWGQASALREAIIMPSTMPASALLNLPEPGTSEPRQPGTQP